jgi:predicted porin
MLGTWGNVDYGRSYRQLSQYHIADNVIDDLLIVRFFVIIQTDT